MENPPAVRCTAGELLSGLLFFFFLGRDLSHR
ncbi:MAG: hypothetical protein JWN15_2923 [Firmicutes bacterium]|nr:hypothetical protein [Bacillota bacterium]